LALSLTVTACGGGGGGDGSSSPSVPQLIVNQSPTVNAGANQTADENTQVSLSGSAADSDGSIASYSWTQASGTNVTLSASDSASTSFMAPEVTSNQILTFTLTVTDNEGTTKSDDITININNVNILPSVNAGENQRISKNKVIELSGTADDVDGTIAVYSWIQTSGTSVILDHSDSAAASFTAKDLTQEETLVFELTVTDNDGGNASDEVSVSIIADTPPLLSADKILVEASQSSGGTITFTATDDLMSETELYDGLSLTCDKDPNETFQISTIYNQIGFYTDSFKPDYEHDCLASITDNIGQTASVGFKLKKLQDSPPPKISFSGPSFITPSQNITVDIIGKINRHGIDLRVVDSELNPVEQSPLTATYANNQLSISLASGLQLPEEGKIYYVGTQVHAESEMASTEYFYGVRLINDSAHYDKFFAVFERLAHEFEHSQDYYHLLMFMLDYAQNNQLISLQQYQEKMASTYPPSPDNATGFDRAKKAIDNLVNYLPSEVIAMTETLNSNDDNALNFEYHYSLMQAFMKEHGEKNFPAVPERNSKKRLIDDSYSNLIGDTAIGDYIDNSWVFHPQYKYLQAVVDMKYWLHVDNSAQTSNALTRNMAIQQRDRVQRQKQLDSEPVSAIYPLGFRSTKRITPPTKAQKRSVSALNSQTPIFNDPYFKDQLWMKHQPNYQGAQSLLALKERFTEIRTSRIAVIDGNFIASDEINFVAGFDAVEMDNQPFVTFEESKAGDYGFHGMAVSSVIGAISNNNYGIAGALSNVEIVPIRVFKDGHFGEGSAIANGIRWAAGYSIEGVTDISQPVDVINLSLGGPDACNHGYQSAIDDALAKGIIIVAASGNDGNNTADSPGTCHGVVSVAANDINANLASFSNYDIKGMIDASAVGVEVPALTIVLGETTFEETISLWDGTSFSTPIVASVLALVKQNLEGFPSALAQQHIKYTAGEFKQACIDCGPGITNSDASMQSALTQPVILATEIVNKYHDFTQGFKQDYLQAQLDSGADACHWWGVTLGNDIVFDSEHTLKLSSLSKEYGLGGANNQFYENNLGDVTLELCNATACIATIATENLQVKPELCQ